MKGRKFIWHHINGLDSADVEFLRTQFQFHVLDFEDLAQTNSIPKLDVYKHYLFAVFHIPRFSDGGRIITDDIEIFLGSEYLVTVTKRPFDALERFFLRASRNPKFRADVMGRDPAYLLYRILRVLFTQSHDVVEELMTHVTKVEDGVYNERDRATTLELARIRRNVLFLRTSLDPERVMLGNMITMEREYLPPEAHVYFDDVRDILDSMWAASDNIKQIIDGLFEVNEALLTHRTNEVMSIFTAIAAAFMPPTLVAGLYGMNVPWLPFIQHPLVVALLLIISFFTTFCLFYLFQHRPYGHTVAPEHSR